jgi:hypothetical protein
VTLAADPIEAVSQCVVAIVNASTAVRTITGRDANNITVYHARATRPKPIVAYLAHQAKEVAGTGGRHYHVDVIFSAEATTHKVANALVRAACEALTVQAFDDLGADAVVITQPDYSALADDAGEPPSTNRAAAAAKAEFTVWITM